MSVLFMVGRGHESPDVMSFLTDLERQASKQPVARVQNVTIRGEKMKKKKYLPCTSKCERGSFYF